MRGQSAGSKLHCRRPSCMLPLATISRFLPLLVLPALEVRSPPPSGTTGIAPHDPPSALPSFPLCCAAGALGLPGRPGDHDGLLPAGKQGRCSAALRLCCCCAGGPRPLHLAPLPARLLPLSQPTPAAPPSLVPAALKFHLQGGHRRQLHHRCRRCGPAALPLLPRPHHFASAPLLGCGRPISAARRRPDVLPCLSCLLPAPVLLASSILCPPHAHPAGPFPPAPAGLLPQVPVDRAHAVAPGPAPPQVGWARGGAGMLWGSRLAVPLAATPAEAASAPVFGQPCEPLAPHAAPLPKPHASHTPRPTTRMPPPCTPAAWWCCLAATTWCQPTWSWRSSSWRGTQPRCARRAACTRVSPFGAQVAGRAACAAAAAAVHRLAPSYKRCPCPCR